MIRFILLTALAMGGCDRYEVRTEPCDPEARAWILECVKNANPMSDEEPEDSTDQCDRTAVRLFCGPSCTIYNKVIRCNPGQG